MKTLSLLLLYVLLATIAYAQSDNICGSHLNLSSISKSDPAFYKRVIAFEEHTKNFIRASNTTGTPENSRLISSDKTIIIPVVVHILYNGTAEDISNARVNSQIQVLNEDFRRLNMDAANTPAAFQSVAADLNFEFRLACIDPDGNATTGITRTATTIDLFDETRPKYTSQGGKDAWPTDTYLNIWVCDMTPPQLGRGNFPTEFYCTAPEKDGVIVDFAVFGVTNSGTNGLGRVATHEVGHWLNIFHVFGDDNDVNACSSDQVDDTPPALFRNSDCHSFPHTSICSPSSPGEMFMNFMDYTPDNCRNLFTQGQKFRARATFAESTVPGVCTRFNAIQNYFSIKPIAAACGTAIVDLQNPMCLPVTWTVTGNATITPTTQANRYQLTGTGSVTITAKGADSYIDDQQFTFSDPPFTFQINAARMDCEEANVTANLQTGTNYNWSVMGDLLIDGTLTSKVTTPHIIGITGTNGSIYVSTTTACGTNYQDNILYTPYVRDVVLDPPSPLYFWDHLNATIEYVPDAIYYRWYVNEVLVGEGANKTDYCTCDYETPDQRQCGFNTIRVEVDIEGCGTFVAGETQFEQACAFGIMKNGVSKILRLKSTGIIKSDLTNNDKFVVYPNPAQHKVFVALPNDGKMKEVRLLTLTGTILQKKQAISGQLDFDLSNLAKGIYIIQVIADRDIISKKVIHIP